MSTNKLVRTSVSHKSMSIDLRLKKSISCKGIDYDSISFDLASSYIPKIGDIALVEVIKIGKHKTIQTETGHIIHIFEKDLILTAFGNRYATALYEGYIPEKATISLDILGSGGVIGKVASKNEAFEDIEATELKLLGYAVDKENNVVNSIYNNKTAIIFNGVTPNKSKIILSLGATMDSGKTTTAGFLARGLKNAAQKVGYIKLTGTAFTKDRDFVFDCGADFVTDFIEAGYPSTYMIEKDDILNLYQYLLNQFKNEVFDYIIVEIADGLVQRETEMLLNDSQFMKTIHHVVLSTADSLSAFWGIEYLTKLGFKPSIVSGRFTMSPLLIKEVKDRCNIPVFNLDELVKPDKLKCFK